MNLLDATKAVCDRWIAQWPALHPGVGYTFDNEGTGEPELTTDGWARVVVREVTSRQHTLGGVGARRFRRGGLILVQLFAPADQGVNAGLTMGESVRTVFEGVEFEGVSTYEANVRQIGPDAPSGGRWYLVVVEIAIDFDHTK